MDQYAVIGSPINHSLSPHIHALFAEQTGQLLEYTAVEVKPDNFFHQINSFAEKGYRGLNVTLPLKGLAWEMADHCEPAANRAKAVNTIRFERDGRRSGFNTDGIGLLRDLTENQNIDLQGSRLLILGAGGAVRGVLASLLYEKPACVVIANRTIEKAQRLAKQSRDLGPVQAVDYENLKDKQFDVVINGTSSSLSGELPPLPDNILSTRAVVYDMLYSAKPTPFMNWGSQQGATACFDGLGMLVEQAAESYSLWRSIRPDSRAVIAAIRQQLYQQ
ncbi:MAG: shikimate dehydrogenase [Gammaproteobacteria bacterium]|nr:shikimate dehydrogenase [Gammaproteobacteria bacterium]